MTTTLLKSNPNYCKEITQTIRGKIRKKLKVINVSNMTWEQKKNEIKEHLYMAYGNIPDGLTFSKRKTKDIKNNPDGLRIFVLCNWIKRNRFYDDGGKFKLGAFIVNINEHIMENS
jgi:uncharacterized protein YfkK (UPF0435 family)